MYSKLTLLKFQEGLLAQRSRDVFSMWTWFPNNDRVQILSVFGPRTNEQKYNFMIITSSLTVKPNSQLGLVAVVF